MTINNNKGSLCLNEFLILDCKIITNCDKRHIYKPDKGGQNSDCGIDYTVSAYRRGSNYNFGSYIESAITCFRFAGFLLLEIPNS